MHRLLVMLALAPLVVSACALAKLSDTPAGQPVYALGNPLCLFACASDLGSVRQDVDGAPAGDVAFSQAASAGAGGVVP